MSRSSHLDRTCLLLVVLAPSTAFANNMGGSYPWLEAFMGLVIALGVVALVSHGLYVLAVRGVIRRWRQHQPVGLLLALATGALLLANGATFVISMSVSIALVCGWVISACSELVSPSTTTAYRPGPDGQMLPVELPKSASAGVELAAVAVLAIAFGVFAYARPTFMLWRNWRMHRRASGAEEVAKASGVEPGAP